MRRTALVLALCLSGCVPAQNPFPQIAGVDPHVLAKCRMWALSTGDQTMYTNTVTGSLVLSGMLTANRQRQIYDACVEAYGR